ncbi:MAG: coenzyme F420-0:L-glutamate ligase [Patescibacteria group bacterium]
MPLEIYPLKSPVLKKDFNLLKAIESVLSKAKLNLKSGDILILSSKIVALSLGRVVDLNKITPSSVAKKLQKTHYGRHEEDPRVIELILREADKVFQGKMLLTLKDGILIPSAGIDFSNAPKGFAILWPKNPWREAQNLRTALARKFKLKKLGVVIIDSHCQPLRWGTTGIALSWAGFLGVEDCRGEKDIFGKPLKVTKKAVADNLASGALLVMGEAAEKIPFALARNAPVKFTNRMQKKSEVFIRPKDCLFGGVIKY